MRNAMKAAIGLQNDTWDDLAFLSFVKTLSEELAKMADDRSQPKIAEALGKVAETSNHLLTLARNQDGTAN